MADTKVLAAGGEAASMKKGGAVRKMPVTSKKGDIESNNNDAAGAIKKSGRTSAGLKRKACALWQALTPSGSMPPRWGHTTCVLGSRLYVFGGTGNKVYGEGFIFDLVSNAWHMINLKGSPPCPRFGHSCVRLSATSKKLMFFGGRGAGGKHYNDLYILNTDKLSWKRYAPTKSTPESRAGHTVTPFYDGSLLLFGGQTKGQRYLNTVHTYLPETKSWQKAKEIGDGPPPRGGHSAVAHNRNLLIFGGFNGRKYFNDLYCYDADNCTWREIPTTGRAPAPRSGHSATVIGEFMVVFGGCASNSSFLNDVAVLDLESLEWQQASVKGPALAARFRHTASLVGQSELYIFGGSGSGVLFNDIAIMHFDVRMVQPVGAGGAGGALNSANLSRNSSQKDLSQDPRLKDSLTKALEEPILIVRDQPQQPPQADEAQAGAVAQNNENDSDAGHAHPAGQDRELSMSAGAANNPAMHTEVIPAQTLQLPRLPNGKVPSVEEVMHMYLGMAMSLRAEKQQREQLEFALKKLESAIAADKHAKEQLASQRAEVQGELIVAQAEMEAVAKAKAKAERSLRNERNKSKNGSHNNEAALEELKRTWSEEKAQLEARVEATERRRAKCESKLARLRAENEQQSGAIDELQSEIARLNSKTSRSERESRKKEKEKEKERAREKEIQELKAQIEEQRIQIRQLIVATNRMKESSKAVPDFGNMSMEEMEELEDFYHRALKGVGLAKQVLLRSQLEELKRAKEVLEDQKLCSVCCDKEIRIVLIPCGHRTLCKECSVILSKCPLCRSDITQRIDTFS